MDEKNGKIRLVILLVFFSLFTILLIAQLINIMIILPDSNENFEPESPIIERGPILDRNSEILAITTNMDSIAAWIPDMDNIDETTNILANTLNINKTDIINKLSSHSGFIWIKRKISYDESEKIKLLKSNNELPGILIKTESGRHYPKNELGCHLIGYTGVDNLGLDGIEYYFQDELSPKIQNTNIKKAYGNQLFLTLDVNIQYYMEKIAKKALNENNADSVMLLVMEAKTGDIISYVSIPGFNPKSYNNYNSSALINRPTRTAFEPGSVFKIFSMASFFYLGGITDNSIFVCNGYYEDLDHNIRINCLGQHGTISPENVLQYSCNAGAAYASETVNNEDFYNLLIQFGFGNTTGISLSGETMGILRPTQDWSLRSKPTISFGQEISVSALQIITAATVFANNGILLKPHIVKKIVSPGGKLIKSFGREEIRRVISKEISDKILLIMESAAAKRARIEGVRVSTKTGTAQVPDLEIGGYSEDKYIASILGIFPTGSPKYIVYVVINNPKGEYYGSKIAAPVFKEAAEKLLSLSHLPENEENIIERPDSIQITLPKDIDFDNNMLNLIGKPKRLLLPFFQREDLYFVIHGEGFVTYQSPPPGTPITPQMKIILEFE